MPRQIHLVINPVAGRPEPILFPLGEIFAAHDMAWQVHITHGSGDARRLARQAVEAGADVVAGYGGDGTIAEIANGLRGSGVPIGLLPGGTGNGVARAAGIPLALREAAALLCQPELTIRHIDAGEVDGAFFIVYAHTGLRPEQRAARHTKSRVGPVAYMLHVLRLMADPQLARYTLTIDGERFVSEGIACVVANTVGLDLPLLSEVNMEDGRLDILLVSRDLLSFTGDLLQMRLPDHLVRHWQASTVRVEVDREQAVWIDGENGGVTPFAASVQRHAIPLIVPDIVS